MHLFIPLLYSSFQDDFAILFLYNDEIKRCNQTFSFPRLRSKLNANLSYESNACTPSGLHDPQFCQVNFLGPDFHCSSRFQELLDLDAAAHAFHEA
jgi:hypothetical protein